jgi:hypothetical protein
VLRQSAVDPGLEAPLRVNETGYGCNVALESG